MEVIFKLNLADIKAHYDDFNSEIGAISEVEVCKRLSAVNGKVSGWHI